MRASCSLATQQLALIPPGSERLLLHSYYTADRPYSTREREAPATFLLHSRSPFFHQGARGSCYILITQQIALLPPGSERLLLQIIYSAKLKWRTTKFETRAGGFCLCSSDFSRQITYILYFLLFTF